jgi:hypothetical protein
MARIKRGGRLSNEALAETIEEIARRLGEGSLLHLDPLVERAREELAARRRADGVRHLSRIGLLLSTSGDLARHVDYVRDKVASIDPLNPERDAALLRALAASVRAESR